MRIAFRHLLLLMSLSVLAGCGRESLAEKARRATNKAGQVVGEGAGSFFTGVGEGVERSVTSYDVRISGELKTAGVSVTIAKHVDPAGTNGPALSFYVMNKSPVTGTLRIRLFNAADQEIGRSIAVVDFKADDARYVPFALDREIPLTMARYVILERKDGQPAVEAVEQQKVPGR